MAGRNFRSYTEISMYLSYLALIIVSIQNY